jgi:pimeloyl-ACP methyl ester carboxylesterase
MHELPKTCRPPAQSCGAVSIVATGGGALGEGFALDAMVAEIIDRASIPGRSREPKLATPLAGCERLDISTPHGDVAAWRAGDQPAALLVHGWRDSARLWEPLMAAMSGRGQSFVTLDLPGHGFSEGERCLIPEVADAVLAVYNALGPIRSLVAHSFACSGTALAVAEGASVDRIVLIAPPLAYRDPGGTAGDAVDAGRQRWRRIAGELGFDPKIGDVAIERYMQSLGQARSEWELSEGLAELDSEVLLLASADDERFDLSAAEATASQLSNCAFHQLAGVDHRGSARDDTAVDAIANFLCDGAVPRARR